MAVNQLDENLTADGNTAEVQWTAGRGLCTVYGTFDTATAKLQFSPDGGTTWIDVGPDVEFTADGVGNFELPGGVLLRVNVSSSGASTDVDAEIMPFGGARG